MQFQEATVITLLELSDMNEELDQFHHNTKKKTQPDYIVADLKARTVLKKITDFVKLSLHHENLSELEKGVGVSRRKLYLVVLLLKYNS